MLFSPIMPSMTEEEIVSSLSKRPSLPVKNAVDLTQYASLAEKTVLDDGTPVTVWDHAFARALSEHDSVHVPASPEAYCICRTIVLKSRQQLHLDPGTVIRAMPGMTIAMLRNEHIVPGNQLPEPENMAPDREIVVTGGIWDYGHTKFDKFGKYDEQGSITGMHGTFTFSNVRDLEIRDLEIRGSAEFCIQLGNADGAQVSGVTFRNSFSDGLHMNGPLRNVYASHLVSEGTGDDVLALNAWDWVESHVTCGPIENVFVEDVVCNRGYSCIRILPGVEHYFDGTTRDCFIRNAVFRDIRKVRNFKLYAQGYPARDHQSETGHLENLFFNGISGLTKMNRIPYDEPYCGQGDQAACFEILADADNLKFDNLSGDFDFSGDPAVVAVGPVSWTVLQGGKDPFFARELFPVDLSCRVGKILLGKVTGKNASLPPDRARLVKAFALSVKKDFVPGRDIARGGTGKGTVGQIVLLP